jgi:hypothetical protein
MSSLITCGGVDVLRGRISLGIRGAWWAELVIATDTPAAVGTRVTIDADGGLRIVGTIASAGVYLATAHVRLEAGAGGLAIEVSGSYQLAQLRDPLAEILRASGETQSATIDPAVLAVPLSWWTLGRAPAARCLDELAAAAAVYLRADIGWRVLADGTVWLGAEAWPSAALPDDAVPATPNPTDRRAVIGCSTPSLLPGVDLEGVGRVVGVDHWIEPNRIRSWASWTDTGERGDLIDRLFDLVDRRLSPRIDRLALYRAEVKAASADGKTVDVLPESPLLKPMQRVPLRFAPGCIAVAHPGAVVLIGWEAGDPSRVYAVPIFEDGASFAKLVLAPDALFLGGEPGAKAMGLHLDPVTAAASMATWIAAAQVVLAAAATLLSLPAPVAPTDFGRLQASATIAKGK